MSSPIVSFQQELHEVQVKLQKEILFKAARFEELISVEMDELDHNACPAIVLGVSRACGYTGTQSIALGAIIQYIVLADKVHRLMSDEEDTPEELRQFPVLVGDFLYGKFFLGLCREKLLKFLAPLAQVIGTMSEGAISRWLADSKELEIDEWLEILGREKASITGTSARLSAELAGASVQIQDKFEAFGRQLGLAWAAWHNRMEKHIISEILQKALEIFNDLPESLQIRPLKELYNYIVSQFSLEFIIDSHAADAASSEG